MREKGRITYRRMTDHIRAMIACGNYRAGDKLPSLRSFAEDFGISRCAAHNGMRKLAEEGIIELRHGSGIYIASGAQEHPGTPIRRLAVITDHATGANVDRSYGAYALNGLQEEARRHCCAINMLFHNYYDLPQPYVVSAAEVRDCAAIVLLGSFDRRGLQLPAGIPAVGLSMQDMGGGRISTIDLDPFAAGELAADFFRKRGCRKVRVLSFDYGVSEVRTRCFMEAFREYGETELVLLADNHPDASLLEAVGCGYFFTSGTPCEYAERVYFARHGCHFRDRVPVLALDGKSLLVPRYQPVNTVAVDWVEAGRALFSEAMRRLESPHTAGRRVYLYPRLYELATDVGKRADVCSMEGTVW